ncbi:MAG: tyrosine-type recombinase/integrase [Nitrososphaeraceae archaeon]
MRSRSGHGSGARTKQQEYFNFLNSLNAPSTKKIYTYCLEQFLNYCKLDLHSFLKLPEEQITDLITEYLDQKKGSRQFKNVIFAVLKHCCDMNDVLGINWKKIKKFTKSQKTGNEISGRDRGYTHAEIQKILEFSDQQIKTAFLILASTGIRIGALPLLKVGDLERIDDLHKVTVYSGEKEQYITFTTPEATKEIDAYLEFRKRRGEHITSESYLIVRKFSKGQKSLPYKGYSLRSILQFNIENTGLRTIGSKFKRKETPILHAFRKFTTKQLVDSKVNPEIREMLLGHKIGLAGVYYKPTIQEMLNEYMKAIPLLTISNEERLKFKLEEHVQIEKTRMESMQDEMNKFKQELAAMKKKRKG